MLGEGVEARTDTKRGCHPGGREPTGAIDRIEACSRNLNGEGAVWEDRCYFCGLGGGLVPSVEALQSPEIIFVSGLCTIK
jgi:hypothetical protein